MTSCSSISTLEIRKEGASRFYLCIEWISTFNCFDYMVLTLMELGSHSSYNDHKHHSSAMKPWLAMIWLLSWCCGYFQCSTFEMFEFYLNFYWLFLLLSTTLLTLQIQIHVCISKFQYNYRSPTFYISHHLKTSKLKDYPQSFIIHFSTFLLINFHAFKLPHLKLSYFFRFVSFFHAPTIPQFQTSMRPLQNFALRASITS